MRAARVLAMMGLALSALCVAWTVRAEQPQPVSVLIIDETQTLLESLQVNVLVKIARQIPGLAVDARFVEVESSFQNPLASEDKPKHYDLIVIIPLDLSSLQTLWMVSHHPSSWSTEMKLAFTQIRGLIEQIFGQTGQKPLDVTEDLIPAWWAGIFQQSGWL